MFEGKYSKALTIGLVVLILVVLGVLTYFIVDYVRTSNDNQDLSDAADRFDGVVNKIDEKNTINDGDEIVSINIQAENIEINTNSSNGTKTYKGFPVVGTIQIPKIDLNLPILEDSNKDAIDVSVAVDVGPGLNKVGNTVIIGHNYRDGRFFSNLKNLANGDKIYITDETGTKVEYTVYNIYTTTPEDSDFMDRDTQGAIEITLDTCTDDTQSRLIIWAKAD